MLKTILTLLVVCGSFAHATEAVPKHVMDYHKKYQAALANTEDVCDPEQEASSTIQPINGSEAKLAMIGCYSGAYNFTSYAYIVKSDAHSTTITPVTVLQYDPSVKGVTATSDLVNADFNSQTNTLTTFAKARGIGDCGQSSETKLIVDKEYGFITVKTTKIRSQDECKGNLRWPVVFRQ